MIDKDDRRAHGDGTKEREYISDNTLGYLIGGGIHNRPSDPELGAAYDKGLRGEQLDADKKRR